MKLYGCLLFLLGALLTLGAAPRSSRAAESPAASRPNIVLITADDMGYSDLGSYGSEIQTPNLDRLAASGTRFTRFYTTPRCAPSRASMLTGLYPHQAGVGHMNEDRELPGYRGRLNERSATLAEALQGAGYHTYLSGKWHLGEARGSRPADRGFEHSFRFQGGATNYFHPNPGKSFLLDEQPVEVRRPGFYLTDEITRRAGEYIDSGADQGSPFFLYVAYNAPHWPLQAPEEDIARYESRYLAGWDEIRSQRLRRMTELGIVDPTWQPAPRDSRVPAWGAVKDPDHEARKMAVYAAQVDRMDQGVGRILAKLEERRLTRETLVLFLSDNGACAEVLKGGSRGVPPGQDGSHESYGPGWAGVSNTPFRLFKRWTHEGGIASPLIVSWPEQLPAGRIERGVGQVIDLMPTLLEAAGARYPESRAGTPLLPLEGRSLLPLLRGEAAAAEPRTLYWEHEGNRAVQQGRWKLVAQHDLPWELYDLEADRGETHNLAASKPQRVRALSALWDAWSQRTGVVPWDRVRTRGGRDEDSD